MLRRCAALAALAMLSAPMVLAQTHTATQTTHPRVAVRPATTVRIYRYSLDTEIGDDAYMGPLEGTTPPASGPSYRVIRDRMGRVLQEDDLQDGKVLSSYKYHYTDASKWFDSYGNWEGGELIGTIKVTRDANNVISRYDHFTAQDEPTSSTAIQDVPDKHEQDSFAYDANKKPTSHWHEWYSPNGYLIRRMNYMSAAGTDSYTDIHYDENTGQAISSTQIENGKLINTKKWSWQANGDLSRVDVYDEKGTWYSADEYAGGLHTRRLYKFTDNASTKEIQYSYDDRRWLTKSVVYHNGQLICTLTYDRLPDGTIKRTLATAPDGTLMAEYPPPYVTDVDADGQAPGRSDAIVHKTGDWWNSPPQTYQSADGRFSVSFPGGTVSHDSKQIDLSGGGTSTLYEFWVDADSGNTSYMVMYNDYTGDYANDGASNVLARVRDGSIKDKTLGTDTVIDLNGVPGRAYTFADKDWNFSVRAFLSGHRLYQVMAVYKPGTQPDFVDTFMKSFQLTGGS